MIIEVNVLSYGDEYESEELELVVQCDKCKEVTTLIVNGSDFKKWAYEYEIV